jgi:hypothetical protein
MTAAVKKVLLEARDLCLSYRNVPVTVTPVDQVNLTLAARTRHPLTLRRDGAPAVLVAALRRPAAR